MLHEASESFLANLPLLVCGLAIGFVVIAEFLA